MLLLLNGLMVVDKICKVAILEVESERTQETPPGSMCSLKLLLRFCALMRRQQQQKNTIIFLDLPFVVFRNDNESNGNKFKGPLRRLGFDSLGAQK